MPCEALIYVMHPSTLAELVEHRDELALRSKSLPDELLNDRTLHGIPVVARENGAGKDACIVREESGAPDGDEEPFPF